MSARVGIVAVGRNEARRLEPCLRSAQAASDAVVFVDSGSTDASVAIAHSLGVRVVELDASQPFTAARARNAGFEVLVAEWPEVELVQFVDADCELVEGWVDAARSYLDAHPDVAVVAGRRREVHPEDSVYNRVTDMEWNTPVGETDACGGDAMLRRRVFEAVAGYDPRLIAGEDPELCYRVRERGDRIVRLDRDMTLHDAAMHTFRQWWRRQARAGHAYAELALRHGGAPERFRVRQLASIVAWGGTVPLLALGAALPSGGASLLLLAGYPLLWMRIWRRCRRDGVPGGHASAYATACLVGKLASFQGVLTFARNRWVRGRPTVLIEYKT